MTSNQIHQWRKTSQYWHIMNTMPEAKRKLRIQKKNGDYMLYTNIIWHAISKEWRKIGGDIKLYKHYNLLTQEPVENQFQDDPTVYIHTSINECNTPKISFKVRWNLSYGYMKEKQYYLPIPLNNRQITHEYIKSLVFEYINTKLMLPEGKYRELQEVMGYSREDTIGLLKVGMKNRDRAQEIWESQIEIFIEWCEKQGYEIDEFTLMSCNDWQKIARQIRNSRKPTKKHRIAQMPNIFDAMEGFDGDVDEAYDHALNILDLDPNTLYF